MPASFSSRRDCGFGWKCNSCSRSGCKRVAEALDEFSEGWPKFASVCRLPSQGHHRGWGGVAQLLPGGEEGKPAAGESSVFTLPMKSMIEMLFKAISHLLKLIFSGNLLYTGLSLDIIIILDRTTKLSRSTALLFCRSSGLLKPRQQVGGMEGRVLSPTVRRLSGARLQGQ